MSKEKKKTKRVESLPKKETQEMLLKRITTGLAGTDSEKLIDLLYNKQNVNEFLIAKKMNLTINQTRNMLYKLADHGLVSFIRKKDKKKGGWYIYFWTLKAKKALSRYREELIASIDSLINQAKNRKTDRYYYSPSIDTEYTEEEAMLNDFTCPETGDILELRESTAIGNKLNLEAKKLEKTLEIINEEIFGLVKKEEKAKNRRINLEKKKKKEEREKRKIERAKLKSKEEKKAKKPIKKKVIKKSKKKMDKAVKKKVIKKSKKKMDKAVKKKVIKKIPKKRNNLLKMIGLKKRLRKNHSKKGKKK